jgi:hypothetical protein
MTILEALKLSKNIKRSWWDHPLDYSGANEYGLPGADIEATDWEPVIEKKTKTVVMYQAVFGGQIRSNIIISDRLFYSEQDAQSYALSFIAGKFIKLLTDRPIEVEVEE